jgi:hypothetical protein
MTTVQTLFGTFNDEQLKALKGAISEINHAMQQIDIQKNQIKDILDTTYDSLKVPKKIINKLAKAQQNQSIQTETAEFNEFVALFEGMNEVK